MNFQTEVFGKWILAGEHAVLRGSPALVFPLYGKSLKLSYRLTQQPLTAQFSGSRGEELRLLFWGVWERALELRGHRHSDVDGEFMLESSLPVGAGMGASAALSVAVVRWFEQRGWVKAFEMYEFARQIENLFHGESSGVDIAVALEGCPLRFERGGERRVIEPCWSPKWYLSYSGSRGVTAECVAQVKEWLEQHPKEGQATDALMRESVELCEKALRSSEPEGIEILAQAIRGARECFERWGLTHGDVDRHMKELEASGAYAVKPTGSGGGGYVLSLWKNPPPLSLTPRLVVL